MTRDIIEKLKEQIVSGITTEVQVVYLMAGIRKLIERDGAQDDFPLLRFHCDWALHSRMDRAGARRLLKIFDEAHLNFKNKLECSDLPRSVQRDLDEIAKMRGFEKEFEKFVDEHGLPQLTRDHRDGWVRFLRLYSKVVEDIPLCVDAKKRGPGRKGDAIKNISRVTMHLDDAKQTVKAAGFEDFFYRMKWTLQDKNGKSGSFSVINSFTVQEPADEG
jgi:hypothetical protein